MKYSFVIIAYNEEHNIAACIQSITKQQNLTDQYEILVIDDGSKDATQEIVRQIGKTNKHVRLITDGANHGRGHGRYRGVEESTGTYIAMIDADIILPAEWLITCLKHIKSYDAVGGIAIPDGDVAFIYRTCKLHAKTVMGSTTVTGNNGLYKASIFRTINFNSRLREGEDVDFNKRAAQAGKLEYCIPGLIVEHQEHKSFGRSMQWLYQSGIGATRQLVVYKEIRLPDLAFFITIFSFIGAITAWIINGNFFWMAAPFICLIATALVHIGGKFDLTPTRPQQSVTAIAIDACLIGCYYVGRTVGPLVLLTDKSKSNS